MRQATRGLVELVRYLRHGSRNTAHVLQLVPFSSITQQDVHEANLVRICTQQHEHNLHAPCIGISSSLSYMWRAQPAA